MIDSQIQHARLGTSRSAESGHICDERANPKQRVRAQLKQGFSRSLRAQVTLDDGPLCYVGNTYGHRASADWPGCSAWALVLNSRLRFAAIVI